MIYTICFGTVTQVDPYEPENGRKFWVAKFTTIIEEPMLVRLKSFREIKVDTQYFVLGSPKIFKDKYIELEVMNAWTVTGESLLANPAYVIAAGNIGRDVRTITTENGEFYSSSIACTNTELWKDEEGKYQRGTTWLNANSSNRLLSMQSKGDKLGGAGSLKARLYEDKNGTERRSLDVSFSQMEPLGKKKQKQQQQKKKTQSSSVGFDDMEMDAPPFDFD